MLLFKTLLPEMVIVGHKDVVQCCAFSLDGELLVNILPQIAFIYTLLSVVIVVFLGMRATIWRHGRLDPTLLSNFQLSIKSTLFLKHHVPSPEVGMMMRLLTLGEIEFKKIPGSFLLFQNLKNTI